MLFFTGPDGDIPVDTSGSTTLPPVTSGGPSQTVPCAKILEYIREKSLAVPTDSRPSDESSTVNSSLLARTTLRALNLTGCYAGTGGSTVRILFSQRQPNRMLNHTDLHGYLGGISTCRLQTQWNYCTSLADWGEHNLSSPDRGRCLINGLYRLYDHAFCSRSGRNQVPARSRVYFLPRLGSSASQCTRRYRLRSSWSVQYGRCRQLGLLRRLRPVRAKRQHSPLLDCTGPFMPREDWYDYLSACCSYGHYPA